jgi:hypothetical protein
LGNVIPLDDQNDVLRESFTYTWKTLPGAGGEIQEGKSTMNSNSKKRVMVAKNVLPVIDEPYMANKVDRPSRIEFQLVSVRMPNSSPEFVSGNYNRFNGELMESENFGKKLDRGGFAKEKVSELSSANGIELASEIYYWFCKSTVWNEVTDVFSDKSGRSVINSGEGTAADINLNLVAALRQAGLESYPVVLSTRGHGVPHPVYPSYNDFNYVVASFIQDGTIYLLDATWDYPFGLLPERCLNGQGYVVTPNGGQWVNLNSNAYLSTDYKTTVGISDGVITLSMKAKHTNHSAIYKLNEILNDGKDEFAENLTDSYSEWEVENLAIPENIENGQLFYEISLSNAIDKANLYLNPFMDGVFNENPFNREDRYSPIDFVYNYKLSSSTELTLPDGYSVELPESMEVALPDDAGVFKYSVINEGRNITLTSEFILSKIRYSPAEYSQIKEFFDTMVEKNNEVIVLKKT